MVEITVLELNLDGAEFTVNAPGSEPSGDTESEAGERDSSGLPLGLVVVAVVAVIAAVGLLTVAKRLRGGDDDAHDDGPP